MAPKYLKIIKKLGKNRVKLNEPMAKHTTFGIGGPADLYYEAKTEREIIAAYNLARELKITYFILGGGSNILVSDKGFRGIIIKIRNSKFAFVPSSGRGKIRNERVIVEAGVNLEELVKKTAQAGLSGLEFAAGIPGTVGGAVVSNAGAWQQSVGREISRVKIFTPNSEFKWLKADECSFRYRESRFKKSREVILEVEFKLKKGKRKEIEEKIRENLEKRKGQPKEPSAGCIFVNPKPDSAGRLIEECGLKGKRIGDTQISLKHADFIVNLGKAKAEDVLRLMKLARQEVKKKFGIELKEEICLLGFDKIKT